MGLAEVAVSCTADKVVVNQSLVVHINPIRAGYRILEGGDDNDEVYNFALFHYASAGFSYTFKNTKKSNLKK